MTLEPLTPQRRRAMTRRHLLDAAAQVFADRGFHGATLDEVAKAAGFTKGAVYSNFKSKDDLFVALLEDRVERQITAIEAGLHEEPTPDLELPVRLANARALVSGLLWHDDWSVLYLEFVLYARRNPDAREKLVGYARRERERVAALIEREHERFGIEPPVPPDTLAAISLAVFNGLGTDHLIDPDAVTPDLIDAVLRVLSAVTLGIPFDALADEPARTDAP